ncbi:unnamed protein product [Orchesella dallaii]|uniref:Uncharacterized protein n=1 Tax=Orchesella dallaii TaxID=48710 RepID=A0ABP1Q075_9HEXA
MDDPVWEIMNENRMVSVPKGCILLKMEKDDWELSVFRSFNAVVVGLPSKFQIDLQCLDTQGLTWKVHNNNTLCIVPTEGRKKPDIVKVKRIKSDNFELFDVLQITFRDDMMKVTFSCEFIYKIHGCIEYIEVIRKDNDYELSIKDAQCNANDNDTGAPVIVNGMSGNGIRIENMFYVNEMNISNSGTLNIRETRVSEVDATVRPPNIVEDGRSDRPEFQRFPSVSPEYAAIEPVGSSNNLEGNEITRPQTSNADLVQNYEEASASFQLSNPSLILNRIPNKVHFMKSWLAESNENQDVGNEDSVENSDSANELVDEAGDTPSPPKTPDPYAEDMEEYEFKTSV